MGILLCCLWSAREEEDESSDKNEGIQVPNVTNRRAPAQSGFMVQEHTNECDNHLGEEKTRPGDEQGCKNRSQVKPEVVTQSKNSIPHKYKLINDSELSRDDECPICLEEYDSENPRIIAKCSHHYHLGCIYAWQERSVLCPNCLGVAEFEELT